MINKMGLKPRNMPWGNKAQQGRVENKFNTYVTTISLITLSDNITNFGFILYLLVLNFTGLITQKNVINPQKGNMEIYNILFDILVKCIKIV